MRLSFLVFVLVLGAGAFGLSACTSTTGCTPGNYQVNSSEGNQNYSGPPPCT